MNRRIHINLDVSGKPGGADNGRFVARDAVDSANGEIARRIYVDEDIYKQEIQHVFKRSWLYIGHESQIPKPGDFVLSRMGDESVILTRDAKGVVHVFLNSCRHRGMKVCRYDEGNARNFVCPYHGWTFKTSGELMLVPGYDEAYKAAPFDKAKWGLVEVAQIANLRGTIWATWDASAPSFKDYMGDMYFSMNLALSPWNGSDDEIELLGSPQKWVIPSNWKIVAENFAGDMAHTISHASVDKVGIGPNNKDGMTEGRRDDPGELALCTTPQGHGVLYGISPEGQEPRDYAVSPPTAAYFLENWRERQKLQGNKGRLTPVVGTIFPNMSFHGQQPRTILVSHPNGPNHTEMWRVYFVDKKAPPEVKAFLRRYYTRYSGPAGMTEQDDMENWNYATASCRGSVAEEYPFNYKAGLHVGGTHPMIPGVITQHPITSEQNVRSLYHRWAEMMDAESWDSLRAPTAADGGRQ
ncbi:MAG: Rieske 2Fe-2S domain-containing protein [Polaromonas sp.]|uniref:aromatic ring-hydroxylating oxygenase subunit alpha n=1 Tax=Polaromonas sp. TaxID=1869339 RepID=UPI0025EDF6FA|nr:Rieske 2Fe-2S domain-containing protein [Polaromonas sp.]MBI2728398.1 Rieske 2Fe-2S domain-containing protein [Polaromonas sp.]